jgi:hypothetical protein
MFRFRFNLIPLLLARLALILCSPGKASGDGERIPRDEGRHEGTLR